jgi:endoglucanase
MKHMTFQGLCGASAALVLCATAACGSSDDVPYATDHNANIMGAEIEGPEADTGRKSGGTPGYGSGPPFAVDGTYEADPPPVNGEIDRRAPPAPVAMPYRGINLAGAEFGSALPGTDGRDYKFPTAQSIDYYVGKGMNTFRIGFKWERLQRSAYAGFDPAYFNQLDGLVKHATARGAKVILNPHNFARYYGTPVGTAQVPAAVFADLWRRFAERYRGDEGVLFNLVNEPNNMPTEQWVFAANAAIRAIRAAGADNVIIVPGNGWSGAHSWYHTYYGTPNAQAMLEIDDSSGNVLYEVHQYMDSNSSGGSDQCVTATTGSERLAPFVKWLRDHGKKGFVGEFAGGRNAGCYAAIDDMLAYMMASSDVLEGWLWWAGGPWWGNYAYTLEPSGGEDRPQMPILEKYLPAAP